MNESHIITLGRPTASGIVCETPCFVYSICGIGLADTSNVYSVYDGQNAEGKLRFRLVAAAYQADFRLFAAPLFFGRGMYIEFTTNGAEVFIQYLELNP